MIKRLPLLKICSLEMPSEQLADHINRPYNRTLLLITINTFSLYLPINSVSNDFVLFCKLKAVFNC